MSNRKISSSNFPVGSQIVPIQKRDDFPYKEQDTRGFSINSSREHEPKLETKLKLTLKIHGDKKNK